MIDFDSIWRAQDVNKGIPLLRFPDVFCFYNPFTQVSNSFLLVRFRSLPSFHVIFG